MKRFLIAIAVLAFSSLTFAQKAGEKITFTATDLNGAPVTSYGSRAIHHEGIIHSFEGEYTMKDGNPARLKKGGHGQAAIDVMDANGIKYEVNKTYSNGVRVGNIPNAAQKFRQSGNHHSWFPKNWTDKTVIAASEYVLKLKKNSGANDENYRNLQRRFCNCLGW